MKKLLFILPILFSVNSFAQTLSLTDCIDAALNNKADIQAIRTENTIAGLQSQELLAKYLPQVSLSYEYRYNPIIPSQIIPVGEFAPIPTDETRAIKFGTAWQQNAGISVYQPIIDASVKSRIEESRINERIKNADLQIASEELIYEVMKTFSAVYLRSIQQQNAVIDTARTFRSWELIKARFEEGKVLKTELNKALLNHHNTLAQLRQAESEKVKEQIYLSFLTGLPLTTVFESAFDFGPFETPGLFDLSPELEMDSIPSIRQLHYQGGLARLQMKNEKKKYIPTVGLQGFLGANQFSDSFSPFQSNSWYGNSYVGLSVKIPILISENTPNRISQFATQSEGIRYRIEEQKNQLNQNILQLSQDIMYLNTQIEMSGENIGLMEENIQILQDRFQEGQINAYDLNSQELDLQKETGNLNQQKAELLQKKLEKAKSSGQLNLLTNKIKGE
ncbi:MAG: TolC family protein [Bacteroidia bacterium]